MDDMRTSDYSHYTGGFEDDIGHFRMEMKKVYPDRDFVRLDLSDSVFNTFYKIESLEMRAPRRSGRSSTATVIWAQTAFTDHSRALLCRPAGHHAC